MSQYRVELISNQSIMEDIIELLEKSISGIQYTIVENAQGKGLSSKKLGNTVWPEMNFILFVYTDLENAKKIKEMVQMLKEKYPREGISCFFTKGEEI